MSDNPTRQLMAMMREEIRAIVREELRAKSGVLPGGPYNVFTVDGTGRITWAGVSETRIVELRYALNTEAVAEELDAWSLVIDTLSIASVNELHYDLTIPLTGSYHLMITGQLFCTISGGAGWRAGDVASFAAMVNGVNVGTIATLMVAEDVSDTTLPISGSIVLALAAGDILNPAFTWANDDSEGLRGQDLDGDTSCFFILAHQEEITL